MNAKRIEIRGATFLISVGLAAGLTACSPISSVIERNALRTIGSILDRIAPDFEPASPASSSIDPDEGVIVVRVDPEGPAAEVGVVRGDILLQIDDQVIDSVRDFQRSLKNYEQGDEVELLILHGDVARTPEVALSDSMGKPYMGITVCCGKNDLSGFMAPEDFHSRDLLHGELAFRILEVIPGSPAAKATLQEGDVILSVEGENFVRNDSLHDVIAKHAPGDVIDLQVLRQTTDNPIDIEVELGENPEVDGLAYLGVRYQPIPFRWIEIMGDELPHHTQFHFWFPPFLERPFIPHHPHHPHLERELPFQFERRFEGELPFDLPQGVAQGLMIAEVLRETPASEAGLREGDIITAIDGEPVSEREPFIQAISARGPGDQVELSIFRPGENEELSIRVQLSEHPEDEGRGYLGVVLGPFISTEISREKQFSERFQDWLDRLEGFLNQFPRKDEFQLESSDA